jgi:hypothetical protein
MIKAIILMFLLTGSLMAEGLNVQLDTRDINEGDSFNVIFRIETESADEPSISFDPIGVEVLGRRSQGVSSRTTYINGRVTRSRELNYAYEMVASKSGTARIRNIKVEIDGKTLTHKDLRIRIGRTVTKSRDFFALALPSKTDIYEGEGITLRYYLYKKIQIPNFDIKQYPKLKGFLKRFMQEPAREERVNYKGELYVRTVLYTAQLFAEKAGELKIDPIKLQVSLSSKKEKRSFWRFWTKSGNGLFKASNKKYLQ